MHVGSLVSPPHTIGNATTSPGASVRVSLLTSGKQSLLPQIRRPSPSSSTSSCSPLSRARRHGTGDVLVTTSSNVGLLPTATDAGARTARPIMSSVHGDPGRGPAGVDGEDASAAMVVVGGVGVRTLARDGTTCSSSGTSVRVRSVVAAAVDPSRLRPVDSVQPTHAGAAQDGDQDQQHHQASSPVDARGEGADRVQHGGNGSARGGRPVARRAAPAAGQTAFP